MQNTSVPGMATPQYNSGESIYVRHSFLVDPQDIQAFIFNLTQAYVCTSSVPGFEPTLVNGQTGCSQDIPGVMEASQGQRFVLFDVNTLPNGIPDIVGNHTAGEHDTLWGWQQTLPTDPNWLLGSTVNNGFSINALPLAVDGTQRTWYFHLVSQVSQAPLSGRRRGVSLTVNRIVRASATPSSPALEGVTIESAGSSSASSDAQSLTPALSSLISYFKDILQ